MEQSPILQVAESICSHPKLASWQDMPTRDWRYMCMACGKKVAIPIMDIIFEEDGKQQSHRQANHAARQRMVDIIGQSFGAQWRAQIQRDANRWESRESI